MVDISAVRSDFDRVIDMYGTPTWKATGSRIYNADADYDGFTWVSAGSEVISGLILPLNKNAYSAEAQYVAQGALEERDYKMFVKASGTFYTEDRFVFGSGSYWIVKIQPPALPSGSEVYKKFYIRELV